MIYTGTGTRSLFCTTIFLLVIQTSLRAQSGFQKLYDASKNMTVDTSDRFIYKTLSVDPSGNINYLDPLKTLLKFKSIFQSKGELRDFYETAGILAALAGDYRSEVCFFDSVENINRNRPVELTKQITSRFDSVSIVDMGHIDQELSSHQIVMLNESHHKVVNRLFAYKFLETLRAKGFSYLAVEALGNLFTQNSKVNCIPITADMGHYTKDPMMAELIRHAVELGFRLVRYDYYGDFVDREVMQAYNISKIIQKDSTAKIVVYAGYGHIEKGLTGLKSMAYFLKLFTKIDLLSINQETFTDGNINSIAQMMYKSLAKKNALNKPGVLLKNSDYYRHNINYDMYLIHPQFPATNFRSSWVKAYGINKKSVVISTKTKKCFLIQAYYATDCAADRPLDSVVPADQTYEANPDYELLLKAGRYYLVERDINYRILKKRLLTVE